MNKANIILRFIAVICIAIGLVAAIMLESLNENRGMTLLSWTLIGSVAGAGIGMIAEMIGKGDMFSDFSEGLAGNTIYGATIGAIIAFKANPITLGISGAIVGAFACVLYRKYVRNFRSGGQFLYDVKFGLIMGAIYVVITSIVERIYQSIFFNIVAEEISYNDIYIIIYSIGQMMALGAVIGAIFGTFFGIIHSIIGARGAIGGAIVGSVIIGEISQSLSGVISGLIIGACVGALLSRGYMKNLTTGALFGGSVCVLLKVAIGVL